MQSGRSKLIQYRSIIQLSSGLSPTHVFEPQILGTEQQFVLHLYKNKVLTWFSYLSIQLLIFG